MAPTGLDCGKLRCHEPDHLDRLRLDKAAAQAGRWRTSEATLHLLALAGGWPGALLAQHWLRHKSAKRAFRAVFWVTVVLNVTGLVVVCSPWGLYSQAV